MTTHANAAGTWQLGDRTVNRLGFGAMRLMARADGSPSDRDTAIAVLQRAYARIRAAEQRVTVGDLDPVTAVRRIAEVTFDHHEANPDFIRLVSIENVHNAEHVRELAARVDLGTPVVRLLDDLLTRGRRDKAFRPDVDAIDVHMMISAFCCFRVANRHTFGAIFGRDLVDPARREHYRRMCGDMVVSYLTH